MARLEDVFTDPDVLHHSSPALLVDPSYHGNVGDSLIAYGELVLLERMGYMNHTECGIVQSGGRNAWCGNFSSFEDGGLALWQGK